MHLVYNFAGPVCTLEIPSEKVSFAVVFVALLVLIGFYSLLLRSYRKLKHEYAASKSIRNWNFARNVIFLAGVIVSFIGFFTGTNVTEASCNRGLWAGFQIQLIYLMFAVIFLALILNLIMICLLCHGFISNNTNGDSSLRKKVFLWLVMNGLVFIIYVYLSWNVDINNLPAVPITIAAISYFLIFRPKKSSK